MDRPWDRQPYDRSVASGRSSPSTSPSLTGRRKAVPQLRPIDVRAAQNGIRSLSGSVHLVSGCSSDGESSHKRIEDVRSPPILAGLPPVPLVAFKKSKKKDQAKPTKQGRGGREAEPDEGWASVEETHRYPSWIEAGYNPQSEGQARSQRPHGGRSVSDQAHLPSKTRRSVHDGTVLHDILDTPSWGLLMSERQQFSPGDQPDVPTIPLHHRPPQMHLLGSMASPGSYVSGTTKGSMPPIYPKSKRKQPKRDSVFDRAAALLQARRLRYATGDGVSNGKRPVASPVELRGVEEYQAREAKRIVDLSDLGEYERKYGMYEGSARRPRQDGKLARGRHGSSRSCELFGLWSDRRQRRHEVTMNKEETARQQKRRRIIVSVACSSRDQELIHLLAVRRNRLSGPTVHHRRRCRIHFTDTEEVL